MMAAPDGRLQWFYSNKFYEVTPLVGYSFINLAKTVIEKLFWYTMVVFFTTLTIINVRAVVLFYLSKPTNTHVKFQCNSSDVSIENFTIELQTSLFELAPQVPITTDHPSVYGLKDIFCTNWHKTEVEKLIQKHISQVSEESQCSSDTTDRSNSTLAEISNNLEKLFSEHNENIPQISYMPKDKDRKIMFQIFQNHFYNFASKWWSKLDKYYKSYLLRFQQILQPMSCPGTLHALERLQNSTQGIRELYKTANNRLNKHFAIDTGIAGSGVFLRQWEGDKKSKNHRMIYQVTLPHDVQSVTLQIYSTKLAYFLLVLDSLERELEYLFFRYHSLDLDIILKNQHYDRGCSVCRDYLYCNNWNYGDLEQLKTTVMMQHLGIVPLEEYSSLYFEWTAAMYSWFTTMAEHYRRTTDLRVNLASGQVKMNVFEKSKILLFATGRFRTLTENCLDQTVTQCVDLCVNDLHLKTCNCYPWHLQHLNTQTSKSMCDEECPEVNNNNCLPECNAGAKQPCDRTFHTNERRQYQLAPMQIGRMRTPSELTLIHDALIDDIKIMPHLPLSSASILLKDPLTYPVYTESYSMSWGDLVSQLGGLMDFWLGLNIMCLAHLMVYVVRQFVAERGACSWALWRAVLGKKAKIDLKLQRMELKGLHEKLVECETELDNILQQADEEEEKLQEFENKMQHVIEKLAIQNVVSEGPMRDEENISNYTNLSKWWWLRGNKFYSQTPLEGYVFINEAGSAMEAMLWYGILLLFTALTIRDIANAFAIYGTRPVTSSAQMVSDTHTGIIPNFTITLTRPFYEYILADYDFFLTSHEYTGMLGSAWPLNFPCKMSESGWMERIDSWSIEVARKGTYALFAASQSDLETILSMDDPEWPQFYEQLKNHISNMNYTNWAEWYEMSMEDFGEYLSDIFEQYRQAVVKYPSFRAVQMSAPMAERFEKLHELLADAANAIADQQSMAITRLSLLETTLHENVTLFSSLVSDELLQKQLEWLDSTIRRQNLELFTRHSNLDIGTLKHEMVLQAVVPESSKEITVEIYSKNFTFMLVLLQQLARHLVELVALISKGINEGNPCIPCYIHLFYCKKYATAVDLTEEYEEQILNMDLSKSILSNFYQNTYLELRQYYSENMALHLESDSGQYELKPFQQHRLNLIPTGRYLSRTEGCYKGSYGRCVDECRLQKYIKSCNCFPYFLHDLVDGKGDDYTMCKDLCALPQDEACETECAAKVEHPCDTMRYRVAQLSLPIIHFGYKDQTPDLHPNRPIFSFSISLTETFTHPKFLEEYSMTASKLFSQLGGRIEFWLGLNVVSLVHMTVYFIRQCKRASNKHTKTGHTLRLMFGMKQNNNDEEATSNDAKPFKAELLKGIQNAIQEVNRKQKDKEERRKIQVHKLEKRLGKML